jgi:autotransporter-associated beta strand protein/T5SS/PEP-CTERM-associated repeat protein
VNISSLTVGNAGTGNFLMSGGTVSTVAVQLGALSGGVGTMAVTSGTFAASGPLLVGGDGTGSLSVDSTGLVYSSTTIVAVGATSSGTLTLLGTRSPIPTPPYVTVSSGTLVTGQVMSGSGQATFVGAGGTLRLAENQADLFSGFADGKVQLGGGGGFFLDTAGYNVGIAVGMSGTGGLTKVGTGTLTLTGSNTYSGGTNVEDGTLLVTTGVGLTQGEDLDISGSANALLEVKGGTVIADRFSVGDGGTGTMKLSSGYLSTEDSVVGTQSAQGTAIVTGGTWASSGVLSVGSYHGTGRLEISGGLVSSSNNSVIASQIGTAAALVSGGTWSTSGTMFLGYRGSGTLTISDSGLVTTSEVRMGSIAGGVGFLNLNGGVLATGGISEGFDSGTVNLNGGTLRLTQSQSALFDGFETGDVIIGNGGVSLDTNGYNVGIATGMVGTGTLTKVGTGTLTLTGSNSHGGTKVQNGTLVLDDGSLNNGGDIDVTGNGNALLEVKGATVNASKIFVGRGDTGTMKLSSGYVSSVDVRIGVDNLNSNGTVMVTGGTLAISNLLSLAAFSGTGRLEISGGLVTSAAAVFTDQGGVGTALVSGGTWNNASTLAVAFRGNSSLTISGSGVVNTGDVVVSQRANGVGTLNLNGGVLATGGVSEVGGSGTVNLNGGTLRLTQNQPALFADFETGDIIIGAGGFHLDTAGYNAGIATSLVGTGTLTKVGTGTLALTGSNSYTGGTKIEAGTLIISDMGAGTSVLGTGDVTVGENGKLAGIGTVLGDTAVAGTLAPGNSPGEMNFAGALLLESTAVVQMELASATVYDQITVGGLLTYDGTLTITFLGGYIPTEGATFALFEAGSVAPGTQFDTITFSDSGYTGTLDYTTGVLTVTAVPEPTVAALLVLGAVGVLARRRVGG